MSTEKTDFKRLKEIITQLDSDPEPGFALANVKAAVNTMKSLCVSERSELNLRIYFLESKLRGR